MANLAYSCGKLEVFYTRMNDIEPYLGQGINYQMTETDKILYYGLLAVYHLKVFHPPHLFTLHHRQRWLGRVHGIPEHSRTGSSRSVQSRDGFGRHQGLVFRDSTCCFLFFSGY
jgi:hypothetical protein